MNSDRQSFEMPHQLTYYEESATGRPTLRTILSLGILASEYQSEALGVGKEFTVPRHLGWVVTSYSGRLGEKAPADGEHLVIGCKALAYNHLLAEREFWVRSEAGYDYARYRGLFVMLDLTKRQLVPIPHDAVAPFGMPQSLRLPKIERPHRIGTDDHLQSCKYQVRFFDIDLNRHVNNAVYSDWMLDPLGADFLLHHRLTSFAIRYEQEVRYGQTVNSRFVVRHQPTLTTLHQIDLGTDKAATAQFGWEETGA